MRIRALGGLANRLRVALSYRTAARTAGLPECEVVWVPDGEIAGAEFEDVFEPIAGIRWLTEIGDEPATTDPTWICGPMWGEAYRELTLRPELRARLDELRALHGRTPAMHVRRSDLPVEWRHSHDALEQFVAWARETTGPMFLATCSGEAQEYMRAELGDRVWWQRDIARHPLEAVSGQRNTTLAEAALDLFVCAGAAAFRGCSTSSFSHLVTRLRTLGGWWS